MVLTLVYGQQTLVNFQKFCVLHVCVCVCVFVVDILFLKKRSIISCTLIQIFIVMNAEFKKCTHNQAGHFYTSTVFTIFLSVMSCVKVRPAWLDMFTLLVKWHYKKHMVILWMVIWWWCDVLWLRRKGRQLTNVTCNLKFLDESVFFLVNTTICSTNMQISLINFVCTVDSKKKVSKSLGTSYLQPEACWLYLLISARKSSTFVKKYCNIGSHKNFSFLISQLVIKLII